MKAIWEEEAEGIRETEKNAKIEGAEEKDDTRGIEKAKKKE